jgi:hypothetical protein
MSIGDVARKVAVPAVLLFSLTAGGVAMCGLPGDATVDDEGILGVYVVDGVDPVGVAYGGTATIAADDADAGRYQVQWIITGAIQEGTGTLAGDELTVEWTTVSGGRGDQAGTASFTVGEDGVLRGSRTVDGADGTGIETLFPEMPKG